MPLGNYKRQLGNDEPLIVPMDSLQNKTTTPAVNLNMPESTFGMIRQGTEKLRSLEVPFFPKTSSLRYLPGELAAETEKLIIPQSEVEGLMQIAPIGMVAKGIGKTPIGKKVAEIGAKEISKIAPSIVKGISKFTQKEIPQPLAQEARKYKSVEGKLKLNFESGGDQLGDEFHGFITAKDSSGKVVGKVDYTYFRGETAVKMIEVKTEARRQGVGTELLKKLQSESDKPIIVQGDFATKEGQALFQKFKMTDLAENSKTIDDFLGKFKKDVGDSWCIDI